MHTHSEFVKTINTLVTQSFGRFYRGNYKILGGTIDGSLAIADDLLVIAKKFTLLDPQFGGGVAGLLGSEEISNPDGSVVVVLKRFEKKAKKYARLYEDAYGKRVDVILADKFDDLFPAIGLLSGSPVPGNFTFVKRDDNNIPVPRIPKSKLDPFFEKYEKQMEN